MKPRILIVDDNDRNRTLLADKMTSDGYLVDTAINGYDALAKIEDAPPDLILLDVMMPVMDGFEACQRIKTNPATKHIPIIMLTAKGEIEDKVSGLGIGAEDYIVKPYSIIEVSARVSSLLSTRILQRHTSDNERINSMANMLETIAHEIRNPLVTIGGMTRRLFEGESDPKRKEYAKAILSSVERMESMLDRLEEYRGILTSPRMESSAINEVVSSALREVKTLNDIDKIDISTELTEPLPYIILNKENLKKAFLNILQNSVDSIEEGGNIKVSTALKGNKVVEVIIKDNGRGIAEERLREIFNPFHTSKMTGAGLGLTIATKVIEDHNGTIDLKSTEGEGTTVTVTLPVAT
ncbi:MAG: response regulator [Deltaproteobacteria bacterium]|nr:response regulator [Deltaproteobacteria bacterium]